MTIDGTNGVTYPDATAQTTANSLGVGQTWQNVITNSPGPRAAGTTYTNTTGRAITVFVQASTGAGGAASISPTVASTLLPVIVYYSANSGYAQSTFFIVPPGATYSVAISGSSSFIAYWFELR